MSGRSERTPAWGWTALSGLGLALPFLLVRYPPMGDLAFHEAAVSLLRHLGDPRFVPPGLYALNLGEPNQLFHLLAYALSFVASTDWACKLVVAASVVCLVTGAGSLAAHLGASRWVALIVAPLAYGWMARWGLVANLLGFGLLLGSLPVLDRGAREPSVRRAVHAALLMALLFLAHESSMVLAAGASALFVLRAPRRPWPVALALVPVVATGALAAIYRARAAGLKVPPLLDQQPIAYSLHDRVVGLPASLYSIGRWSPVLLAASVAVVVLLRVLSRPSAGPAGTPWRFVVLGLGCGLGYFVVPEVVMGATLVHQRLLPPAFAVLVAAALSRRAVSPRALPLVVLLPLGMLAATRHLFAEADRSYRDLDAVLARMEDGSATAQLDLTPRGPSLVAPVVGGAARALAVHGGRLMLTFTNSPTYPLTMPPERRWDEPARRMLMTPFAFAPSHDLTRFRYVLVWEPAARIRAVLDDAFAPEARRLAGQGSWLLYESTLPRVSVVAGDQPLPSPPPTPLATRVKALLAARGE